MKYICPLKTEAQGRLITQPEHDGYREVFGEPIPKIGINVSTEIRTEIFRLHDLLPHRSQKILDALPNVSAAY
jgi:hypothetical protein